MGLEVKKKELLSRCIKRILAKWGVRGKPTVYAGLKGKKYDFRGTSNPIKLNEIPIFEKRNKISINVLYIDQEGGNDIIATAHLCKKLYRKHVNLLMITSANGGNHFCWIKDLSRLLRRFSPKT